MKKETVKKKKKIDEATIRKQLIENARKKGVDEDEILRKMIVADFLVK